MVPSSVACLGSLVVYQAIVVNVAYIHAGDLFKSFARKQWLLVASRPGNPYVAYIYMRGVFSLSSFARKQ